MTLKKILSLMIIAASINLAAMENSVNKFEFTQEKFDAAAKSLSSFGQDIAKELSENLRHAVGKKFSLNEWRNEIIDACNKTLVNNSALSKSSSIQSLLIRAIINL